MHIIVFAARFKLVEIPDHAKNVPLGQKRKRGRPALAKTALIVQPPPNIQESNELPVEQNGCVEFDNPDEDEEAN